MYFDVIPLWASMVVVDDRDMANASAAATAIRGVSRQRDVRLDSRLRVFPICRLQIPDRRRHSLIRLGDFLAISEVAVGVELPRRRDDALHGIRHGNALTFGQRGRAWFEDQGDGFGCRRRQPHLREVAFVDERFDFAGALASSARSSGVPLGSFVSSRASASAGGT